jgi:apolipoprotein D and lipocalin family protein
VPFCSYISMKKPIIILSLLSLLGCGGKTTLNTVESVDVKKYAGKWYEIASMPFGPQKNCDCTSAEYSLNEDGTIKVYNKCYDREKKKIVDITGKASAVKGSNNASLNVVFFWPFKGDYNIIALAPDYSYALVGTESRDYMWVLSRTPEMDNAILEQLKIVATQQGFDVSKLRMTRQSGC